MPITISSVQYNYGNNILEQTATENVYYKSSEKLLVNTWTQHIRYTRETLHFNEYRARIYDVYGTMSGGGSCFDESNYEKEINPNPWARTKFTFTVPNLQSYWVAYSSYSTYDIWTTERS